MTNSIVMKLKLEVTEQDILDGVKKDPCRCPIALAVRRAFPDWQEVEVSNEGIKVLDSLNTYWLTGRQHLSVLIDFMEFFDEGGEVNPFTLDINFEEEEREPLDWEY